MFIKLGLYWTRNQTFQVLNQFDAEGGGPLKWWPGYAQKYQEGHNKYIFSHQTNFVEWLVIILLLIEDARIVYANEGRERFDPKAESCLEHPRGCSRKGRALRCCSDARGFPPTGGWSTSNIDRNKFIFIRRCCWFVYSSSYIHWGGFVVWSSSVIWASLFFCWWQAILRYRYAPATRRFVTHDLAQRLIWKFLNTAYRERLPVVVGHDTGLYGENSVWAWDVQCVCAAVSVAEVPSSGSKFRDQCEVSQYISQYGVSWAVALFLVVVVIHLNGLAGLTDKMRGEIHEEPTAAHELRSVCAQRCQWPKSQVPRPMPRVPVQSHRIYACCLCMSIEV